MADLKNKVSRNVAGQWYVDNDCIDCDLCRTTAPDNFTANEDDGYSYVSRQPATEEEAAQCQQALEECPVEAIGNDSQSDSPDQKTEPA